MNVENEKPNISEKAKLNRFDKTILDHTPKLFEMLGWMSLIGLFNYIAVLTNDVKIFVLYYVSLFLFGLYIQVYIYNELHIKTRIKNIYLALGSLVLAAIIGIGLFLFLQSVIPNIAALT